MIVAAIKNLATKYFNVAAAAATQQVIAYPSILCRVVVTTAGSAAVTFYDNVAGDTSGNIIGALPAVTTVGQSFEFLVPANLGISASGGANTPAYVLTFAQTNNQ